MENTITWNEIQLRVDKLDKTKKYYGVPRGGSVIAAMLNPVMTPDEADIIIDDLIDSGRTKEKYNLLYPNKPFITLFDKHVEYQNSWLIFPWEEDKEKDIIDILIRQLEYIGEDASREGLKETPIRIIKSWEKLFGGYKQNYSEILSKTFIDGSCDEMVILKDINFYSTCEHHFLPFFGKVSIGYIPNGLVVGVSKLARLTECFARRLQIQERMTTQIANSLTKQLNPKGVIVVCEAQHFCMTARGVEKQTSKMVTSAVRGIFKEDYKARDEFFKLIK